MKNNNKKKNLLPIILAAVMLTGCGSKNDMEFISADTATNNYYKGDSLNYSPAESYDAEENETYAEDSENKIQNLSDKKNNTSDDIIVKEMLVYSCNMTVDVLDFNEAITAFRRSLETYGAFADNENYSDGASLSKWHDPEAEKWQTYTATIRVPSSNYDAFCNSTSELGDLRSKTAKVDNLSTEYYDLSTELEIYEAKEMRYKELLKTITDEKYAISVEEELTQIQIQISKIKTRMHRIKTDVAYSYVYITINEVREYVEKPVKTDTFAQRIGNAASKAWNGFLSSAEDFLIFIIYVLPYAVVGGAVLALILKLHKRSQNKRQNAVQTSAAAAPEVPNIPEQENSEDN